MSAPSVPEPSPVNFPNLPEVRAGLLITAKQIFYAEVSNALLSADSVAGGIDLGVLRGIISSRLASWWAAFQAGHPQMIGGEILSAIVTEEVLPKIVDSVIGMAQTELGALAGLVKAPVVDDPSLPPVVITGGAS